MKRAASTSAVLARTVIALTVIALSVLALTGCAGSAEQPVAAVAADSPGITARGVGTVTGTPDTVTVVLGVQTRGPSAQGALDDNSGRASALIGVLTGRGVAPTDLRTSQLSIYPTYADSSGRITGYEVTNQVTATMHDITAAGALIDAAAEAAGDAVRVQQLDFSIDDDSAPKAQARADAVRRAMAQARQMAEAAGVRLGPVRTISEVPTDQPRPLSFDASSVAESAAVPLQPGTEELTVQVEVVYGIDQ